jgi:hypothetical protein
MAKRFFLPVTVYLVDIYSTLVDLLGLEMLDIKYPL